MSKLEEQQPQYKGPVTFTNPEEWIPLTLIKKIEVNYNTRHFIFALPSNKHVIGLSTGQHVKLSANINNEIVSHSYTPVSSNDNQGYLDLLIKIYFKDSNFPSGGRLTQYIENLKIGDTLNFRGPLGLIVYKGNGYFKIRKDRKSDEHQLRHFREIGLIAGGTGIAPMLQVIYKVLTNPSDKTKITLLFANQSEKDIMLRNELDELATKHLDRFKIWYTIDRTDNTDWKYSTGYVDAKMISEHLPLFTNFDFIPKNNEFECADEFSGIFVCGSKPMVNSALIPDLEKLNVKNRFVF